MRYNDVDNRSSWNVDSLAEIKAAQDKANEQARGGEKPIPEVQIGGPYGIPSCAHLTVGYVRQHLGAGKERGWWQCTECETKFVPAPGTAPPLSYDGH